MQDTEQKLREALQAISHIDDSTNHAVDASAALDRIGQIARQALALPTTEPEQTTYKVAGYADINDFGRIRAILSKPKGSVKTPIYVQVANKPTTQAQEPADCDGGTCGIGGYCNDCTQPQAQELPDERAGIEESAAAIFETDKRMWMSGPSYNDLHENDKARLRAMARAALSAGDAVDAQRYRWLRDESFSDIWDFGGCYPRTGLDTTIDAAIAARLPIAMQPVPQPHQRNRSNP